MTVAQLGRWGAQWHWYTDWSGRFVAIGFSTVFNPLSYGPRTGVAPTGIVALRGLLLLLLLGLAIATQQLFRALLGWPGLAAPAAPRGLSWVLTLAVLTLSFNALPEPFSLLFWYSGAANYALPLALTRPDQSVYQCHCAPQRPSWATVTALL